MNFTEDQLIIIAVALQLWTLPWKGMALWKAAKASSPRWFILLLVVNTIGILEIIYLFFIKPKAKIIINKKKAQ